MRRHPRGLRRRRRRAGPSQGVSGDGRPDLRGVWLLRPALRPARGSAGPLSGTAAKAVSKGRPIAQGDHLYLIDGSRYIFRAYHALPPLSRKSDGLPTNAVSGYCNMIWKLLQDMKGWERPTHLAVIFDAGARTFRNDIYKEYKAN